MRDEWVSVKDELPEDDEKVLVCTVNGKIVISSMDTSVGGRQWRGSRNFNDSIVAWMPLPAPFEY